MKVRYAEKCYNLLFPSQCNYVTSFMSLSDTELVYYARHLSLEAIGIDGQTKLKNARVLCIGAGGLGCPVLLYLAAAGIGTLGIVDGDQIEISNLHRQILYSTDNIGEFKADVAAKKLAQLNPYIQMVPHTFALTGANIFELIAGYDILVDCSDNFSTRYLVNDACFYSAKPNVQASIAQFAGQCSIFTANNGPCYRCLFDSPPPPNLIQNCADAGVLGVLPGILGSIQALEVIKLITGTGTPLIGALLTIDALSLTFNTLALQKNPECPLCRYQQPFGSLPGIAEKCTTTRLADDTMATITAQALQACQKNEQIFILDVREPYEYEICNLGGYLIPLSELAGRLHELNPDQRIVVHCKKGPRSQQAAALLKQAGFKDVCYLAGGILAWKEAIEANI